MTTLAEKDIAALKASGLFDADWYRATYPDVDALRMDPAEHYVKYGSAMGRMSAAGERLDLSVLERLERLPAPKPGRALLEAHEICRSGDDALGLAYARRHLPPELSYTIETLRANAALRRKDEAAWLRHLNALLARYGSAPVRLKEGPTVLERLATAPLPAVTGGPLISVIVTAYNAERTIRAALQSILNQTYRNLEVIVIDDRSEDLTWSHICNIAQGDARIKAVRNPANIGTYCSKNIGLRIASGEWVTGHDADDWAHPEWIHKHLQFILRGDMASRVSNAMMLRMQFSGEIDRLTPIGAYSIDGASRDAPISCLFKRDFLRDVLGGWDSVRFGADSEIIERSKIILGDEFKRVPVLGMLCMISAEGLTSQPEHFIDSRTGPSENPRIYAQSYRKWHEGYKSKPAEFPRLDLLRAVGERFFPAPQSFLPYQPSIARAVSSNLSDLAEREHRVSVLCASRRPALVPLVAKMLQCQSHRNYELVFVAHGGNFQKDHLESAFSCLPSFTLIEASDSIPFGVALNMGLEACSSDLVMKMDDDDFYGPAYIARSLSAFLHNGHDNVGVVGKGRAYVYVSAMNFLGIRFPDRNENCIRSHVFGGTLFWSRRRTDYQVFRPLAKGVDVAFLEDVQNRGCRVFSGDRFDYIHFRHLKPSHHTWQITDDDFIRPANKIHTGLDLALACSSYDREGLAELQEKFDTMLLESETKAQGNEPLQSGTKSVLS
ncbi:glycosyltransferase [Tabrizicola sp. YIM 78059]|uniref:glycosyltransferase family 2 protein n=1 Tax=Tabrizicola sp. YIM 78059 TaxID=2529861 RepID=UPI0010AB210B|nr:glycosyltransferase [Tabrizicola sp. YIM 78059]